MIDGFEDGDIAEWSGDTAAYTASTANPFDGSYSLEATTTSVGAQTLIRTDVTWGPAEASTLQCQLHRDHTAALLFGVQSTTAFYYAQLRDSGTSDTEVVLAKSDSGFTSLSVTALGIDRTAYDWLRLVVDWDSSGSMTVTVYDQTATKLGSTTATDSTHGAGGVGVDVYADTDTERMTYLDSIEAVSTDSADVATRTMLDAEYNTRTAITGNTQMKQEQNVTFVQGDTQIFIVSVVDANDNPVDLTGADIEYTLKSDGPVNTMITKTRNDGVTVTDAIGGQFEIALEPADTSNFNSGEHRHQIELTDSDGDVATILGGTVSITDSLQ